MCVVGTGTALHPPLTLKHRNLAVELLLQPVDVGEVSSNHVTVHRSGRRCAPERFNNRRCFGQEIGHLCACACMRVSSTRACVNARVSSTRACVNVRVHDPRLCGRARAHASVHIGGCVRTWSCFERIYFSPRCPARLHHHQRSQLQLHSSSSSC